MLLINESNKGTQVLIERIMQNIARVSICIILVQVLEIGIHTSTKDARVCDFGHGPKVSILLVPGVDTFISVNSLSKGVKSLIHMCRHLSLRTCIITHYLQVSTLSIPGGNTLCSRCSSLASIFWCRHFLSQVFTFLTQNIFFYFLGLWSIDHFTFFELSSLWMCMIMNIFFPVRFYEFLLYV